MRALAVLCLMLAACAANEPPAARACSAQADEDPEVKRLLAASAGSQAFALQHYYELRDARQQAQTRCLRARGLAAPGGVEAPKRDYNLFDSLL